MFDSLSDKQREVVFDKQGKFVVRACPGSGKTYSVAARLAYQISNWTKSCQGISTVSFTNVAWQEIEKMVSENFNIRTPISYPHFLGTIDSFVNQFIFLPYGHLIMGCDRRPILVGPPHGDWTVKRYDKDPDQYFDKVTYGINDELIYPKIQGIFFFGYNKFYKKDGSESQHAINIREVKNKYWKEGYATQADANYFAYKVLEKFPIIAKSIVNKFSTFIIDEAQDTNDVQMKIIDILIENGLQEIALIGDPDQAIFEWNEAKPQLFIEKYNAWEDNSMVLNENRRSSQNICNYTYGLSSLEARSIAVDDEMKDDVTMPEIVVYDESDLQSTIDLFLSKCNELNITISKESVAVICRSSNLLNNIVGIEYVPQEKLPWKYDNILTKEFARAKYLYDKGEFKQSFEILEKAIIKSTRSITHVSKDILEKEEIEIGFKQYRQRIFKVMNLLPETDKAIDEWVDLANKSLPSIMPDTTLSITRDGAPLTLDTLFSSEKKEVNELPYRIGTVHSVKGETFKAVLVLLKTKGRDKYYRTLIKNNVSTAENEELRIVYVAITRPRRLLVLAVPNENDKEAWMTKLG